MKLKYIAMKQKYFRTPQLTKSTFQVFVKNTFVEFGVPSESKVELCRTMNGSDLERGNDTSPNCNAVSHNPLQCLRLQKLRELRDKY